MSPGCTMVGSGRYVGPMPRTPSAVLAMLVVSATLSAGCSDDDQASPTTSAPADAGDLSAFCESARSLADAGGVDLSAGDDDPVAAVSAMAEQAPPELAADFEVFLGGLERAAQLEQDDPAALQTIVALLGDDEFASAANRIRDGAQDECGVDIKVSTGPLQD